MHQLARIISGSNAYGTNHAASDVDIKGVHLPGVDDILLGRAAGETHVRGPERDAESFTLGFFMSMLRAGVPVAIEMMFSPHSLHLQDPDERWLELVENRERLLSRKTLFVRNSKTQRERYLRINSNLKTLAAMRQVVDGGAGYVRDLQAELLALPGVSQARKGVQGAGVELGHDVTLATAVALIEKQLATYGERALRAAEQRGQDWPSQMHALRILEEGIEFHFTGRVTLPRPNASELLPIRFGQIPASVVDARLADAEARFLEAENRSVLPPVSDEAWAENFLLDVLGRHVAGAYGSRLVDESHHRWAASLA